MTKERPGGSTPSSISSTLLARVRARRPEAWRQLVDLYGPVVYRWCRQSNLEPNDAADVVQEVFGAVSRHLLRFHREGSRDSFTAWLATITRNKVRDHYRQLLRGPLAQGGTQAQEQLQQIPEPPDFSSPAYHPDANGRLSRRAVLLVRAEFENRTWEAFWQTAVLDRRPADVADQLGMSLQAVYKAKSRVLRRVRQELNGLID